jgi:5'-methylthioadenosine phosphorylase
MNHINARAITQDGDMDTFSSIAELRQFAGHPVVGIFAGTGMEDVLARLKNKKIIKFSFRPWGAPSSLVYCGHWNGVQVAVLLRHDEFHRMIPTVVPFRANVAALWALGCKCVIALTTAGAYFEEVPPGTIVLPQQFIDMTKCRPRTFYDQGQCATHVGMADPFCHHNLWFDLDSTARHVLAPDKYYTGTQEVVFVTIEGPQFSTKAESRMYRKLLWLMEVLGIVGMTTSTEALLCRDAGLSFQPIGLVTDWDAWKQGEQVDGQVVQETAKSLKPMAIDLLDEFFRRLGAGELQILPCECHRAPEIGLHTPVDYIPEHAAEQVPGLEQVIREKRAR